MKNNNNGKNLTPPIRDIPVSIPQRAVKKYARTNTKNAIRLISHAIFILFFFIIVQISIPIKIHESTPDTVTKYPPPIIPAIIISAIQ